MSDFIVKPTCSEEESLLLDLSTLNHSLHKKKQILDLARLRSIIARAIPCRDDVDIQYNIKFLSNKCKQLSLYNIGRLLDVVIQPIFNIAAVREGQIRLYMQLTEGNGGGNAAEFISQVCRSTAPIEELSIDISFTHPNHHVEHQLYQNINDLMSTIPDLSKLKKFSFRADKIHFHPAFIILSSLKRATSLEVLNLTSNRLGANSILISTLMMTIKKMKKLKVLKLGGNLIGSKGVKQISFVLERLRFLESLDLSNNFIGSEGVQALKEAVAEQKKLKLRRWDFTNCTLSTEVASELRSSLGSLVSLF